ncbi:MAG: hypothetical protein ABSG61_15265 [Gemmatimonadales bacterium]
MTRTLWAVLAVLCAWGFITIVRRISEEEQSEQLRDGKLDSGYQNESLKDSIDWDELEKAEDEVKGIDPLAKPEDGFEGDDWGPGAAPKPPVA